MKAINGGKSLDESLSLGELEIDILTRGFCRPVVNLIWYTAVVQKCQWKGYNLKVIRVDVERPLSQVFSNVLRNFIFCQIRPFIESIIKACMLTCINVTLYRKYWQFNINSIEFESRRYNFHALFKTGKELHLNLKDFATICKFVCC